MSAKKIVVLGSSNTDMVIKSKYLPQAGETILGGQFMMNPGGKGANQAVAAARLGGEVTFIAKVGNDIFGQSAIQGFQKDNINTKHIFIDEKTPSGVALIMVDDHGENCISVALGANATMDIADIDSVLPVLINADFLLIQLETPLDVVAYSVKKASTAKAKVVLNPAPAAQLPDEVFKYIHYITPNQSEAELLTGIPVTDENSARQAAKILQEKGIENIIITLGAKGAYVLANDIDEVIPSIKVKAVDTTAAGDNFNGALIVGLSEGMNLRDAVAFANQAAAISVTRLGAQASCPNREEIK
jgi:ribokinase